MPLEPWREIHPLESPLRKIRRAEKHVEAINGYIALWESLDPNSLVINLSADRTLHECRLVAKFPPFHDFGIALGEFAYQLRSALDQIVFALSDFNNLSKKELEDAESRTSFPILTRRNDNAIQKRLRFVPDRTRERAWKAVDFAQPYQRGDLAEQHGLAVLNQLSIRDKHRILDPVADGFRFNRDGINPEVWIAEGSVNDGDVVARVPSHLDPQVELDGRFSREITIPLSHPEGGVSIHRVGEIYGYVAFEVLPRFFELFDPLPPTVKIPQPREL